MSYFFYILFGLLPSVIWLLFYLRKDSHPESNIMVLKIFFYGALAALAALFLELGFFKITEKLGLSASLTLILNTFIGVAMIEEVLKYLVVKLNVLRNPEFDEPLDAMLYMIIAALGFAALENVLILWSDAKPLYLLETFTFSAFRFIGATFLHALCSGTVGYFLAVHLSQAPKRKGLLAAGLWTAILLHGFYNYSIISIRGTQKFIVPVLILITLAPCVSWGFKKLKRLKSVCKI